MQIKAYLGLLLAPVAAALSAYAPAAANLELDHVWIVVSPDAPERSALKRAGFLISNDINHHEGQGTSSITVEFQNAFLELIWPDASVPVSTGLERAAEKFRNRMSWRASGWCPIGIGLHRTSTSQVTFPFKTWSISAPWLPGNSAIEMLTPREDTKSPSAFISPNALSAAQDQAARGTLYHHPLGVTRVTSVRLIHPKSYVPIEALTYLEAQGALEIKPGEGWLVEIIFDGEKNKKTKDLRPDLPVLIRY